MQRSRHLALRAAPLLFVAFGLMSGCGDDAKPDTAAPEVAITAPSSGSVVAPEALVVRGTAIDPKVKGRKTSGLASVTVNGVAATLGPASEDPRTFEATLTDLPTGPLEIEAVAADKKGNLGSAMVQVVVSPPLSGLILDPTVVVLESIGATSRPIVWGYVEGGGRRDVAAEATYLSADPTIATVAADGTVTAVKAGRTSVEVTAGAFSFTLRVLVEVDETPPARPEVYTYRAETNQTSQLWIGRSEPGTTLTIAGGESPLTEEVGEGGRFMVSVPLTANTLNELVVTVTDGSGNASTHEFPIRQNDALVDSGVLVQSDGDQQTGIVDETLPLPLVVRATDPKGNALPNLDVDFALVGGDGAMTALGTDASFLGAETGIGSVLRVKTDAGGRARINWKLGEASLGRDNEIHAALVGASRQPVVFRATGLLPSSGPAVIIGRVLDENRRPVVDLEVTLLEEGSEFSADSTGKVVRTDRLGRFELTYGPEMVEPETTRLAHLRFDGTRREATERHARIDFVVPVLPHQRNNGGVFFVPRLPEGVALDLDANNVVQTEAVLTRSLTPGARPTIVKVPVGTKVTWPANVPADARKLTLLAIPINRTPMSVQDGLFTAQVMALQPGGTRFDPPLPLALPNLDALAPGETAAMFSYDHLETRFVQTGSATVNGDGTYLESDPGSGIRVGAWHNVPPPRPPDPCPTKATATKANPPPGPKPEKKECICREGDREWVCLIPLDEEKKEKIENPNAPCTPPGPPPPNPCTGSECTPPKPPKPKLEIICEEEKKAVKITSPIEKTKKVKTGTTVIFRAYCPDGESDGDIAWTTSGGVATGNKGPIIRVKFEQKGKYRVSASGTTKTCDGTDFRSIEAVTCADAGIVRVCGDTLEEVDGKTRVSGNVTIGLTGPELPPGEAAPIGGGEEGRQYLKVSAPVTVSTADVTGDGQWNISTSFMGIDIPDLPIWRGGFSITPAGKVTFVPKMVLGEEDTALKLVGFPIFSKGAQLLDDGVSFDTPDWKVLDAAKWPRAKQWRCDKNIVQVGGDEFEPIYEPACRDEDDLVEVTQKEPRKLEFILEGLEIRNKGVIPQGTLNLEREIDLALFKLTKLSLKYANNEFTGSIGLQFGKGPISTGLAVSGTYGASGVYNAGRWKKVSMSASFTKSIPGPVSAIVFPGIPIAPATPFGPAYLSSVGLTINEPGFILGTSNFPPKLEGSIGITMGPGLKIGDGTFALATGTITGAWSPTELSIAGKLGILGRVRTYSGDMLVTQQGVPDIISGTISAAITYPLDPRNGMSAKVGIVLSAKEPLTGSAVLSGGIEGSLTRYNDPDRLVGNMRGYVSMNIPDNPVIGPVVLGQAEGTITTRTVPSRNQADIELRAFIGQMCFTPYFGVCKYHLEHDPVNGLRIYFQEPGGIIIRLFGKHPSTITAAPTAPSLGVSPGVEWSAPYAGFDPTFELFDAVTGLEVSLDHEGELMADLELPDGTVLLAADGLRPGSAFYRTVEGDESLWLVGNALPGTYRLVNVRGSGQLRTVTARAQPVAPTFAFDEPFAIDEGLATLTWTGADPDSAASVTLWAEPVTASGAALAGTNTITIGEATLTAGELDWSLQGVPPGAYRIIATVADGQSGAASYKSARLVVVAPSVGEVPAPSLVRYTDGVLSWLPSAGAVEYRVLVATESGSEERTAASNSTSMTFASSGERPLSIAAFGELGRRSIDVAITGDESHRASRQLASVVRVGEPWSFVYTRADGETPAGLTLAVVQAPAGVTADGLDLTWTPTEDQLGDHLVSFSVDGLTLSTTVTVHPVDRPLPPELLGVPAAFGTIGAEWTWALLTRANGTDTSLAADLDLELFLGPDDAELDPETGLVTWTPTAQTVAAFEGYVTLAVRATDPTTGLSTERHVVVRFLDSDGDGLSDAWERASGLDPLTVTSLTADPDTDGVSNLTELQRNTRADRADSDGDGLNDGDEQTATTDPRNPDSDGDTLLDGAEAALDADPTKLDSDGDGVSDGEEVTRGTAPDVAATDTDNDGLNNDDEARLDTDPNLADTDDDGLSDGDEVTRGTNPRAADSDGDGASDGDEVLANTNALGSIVDRDVDGLSDDLEVVLGTNPAADDSDGDLYPDGFELEVGTDPKSSTSKPDDAVAPTPSAPTIFVGESADIAREPFTVTDLGLIILYADSDGDGAPDDFEAVNNYDPADADDGTSDDDGDGVPMWRESRLGTNPRLADSDGDGVDDGFELQDGTDPADAESFVPGGPISVIRVVPPRARLVTNTVLGAARLQLAVLGERGAGVPTDLTSADRGTTYTIEPSTAGVVDGNGLFLANATFEGEATVTATNLALTATSDLIITRFTPRKISSLALPKMPGRLALDGDVVAVVVGTGVCLVDVSILETPVLGGCLELGPISDVAMRGDLLLATVETPPALAVMAIDRTALSTPATLQSLIPLPTTAQSLALGEVRAFVATSKGLHTVDLDQPGYGLVDVDNDTRDDRIVETQLLDLDFQLVRRDLDRVASFSADGNLRGWRVVSNGLVLESTTNLGSIGAWDMAFRGNAVWFARLNAGISRTFLSRPSGFEASVTGTTFSTRLVPSGDTLLVGVRGNESMFFVGDRLPGSMPALGTIDYSQLDPTGLAANRQYHFMAGFNGSPNYQLEIGQHAIHQDLLGIPPTITPISPPPGQIYDEGTPFTFAVNAVDDVALENVTLSIDGELVEAFTAPPYRVSRRMPGVATEQTILLSAEAEDIGGNVGRLEPFPVIVRPIVDDVAPTVTLVEPIEGEYVATGSRMRVEVNALDDIAVHKVEIRLDGTVVLTIDEPPFIGFVDLPETSPTGQATLTATAIDYGENTATTTVPLVLAGLDLVARGVTRIAPDDTTYDGQTVLVREGTVAIDGAHTFDKIYVGRRGTLTHSDATSTNGNVGLDVTADFIGVAPGGSIDLSGRGYRGDCMPAGGGCGGGGHGEDNVYGAGGKQLGGGSHGGIGGGNSNATYGDALAPTTMGSGGGYGNGGGEHGGAGGGRARIVVDTFELHGQLAADGALPGTAGGALGGPGAGGSVWLTVGELFGSGKISASGGSARTTGGSAGGGGRVRIDYDQADFDLGRVRATPGGGVSGAAPAARAGGAGTVVLREGNQRPRLIIDDGGLSRGVDSRPLSWTPATEPLVIDVDLITRGDATVVVTRPLEVETITLEGRSRLVHLQTTALLEAGLTLTATAITIGADAAIDLTGRGYGGDCTPFAGGCGGGGRGVGNVYGTGAKQLRGASHGGTGGADIEPTYGDPFAPTTPGAGGGYGNSGADHGGTGGGRLRLFADTLTVDGQIRADGSAPLTGLRNGGPGAGGSLWLTVDTLAGTGTIAADGGSAVVAEAQAGGGGRVRVDYGSATFDLARVTAAPGTLTAPAPGAPGGPGTVYLVPTTGRPRLVIADLNRSSLVDNRPLGFLASATAFTADLELIVRGTSRLVATRPLAVHTLRLDDSARVSSLETRADFISDLTLTTTALIIGPNASLDVNGRGFGGDCGPDDSGCGNGAQGENNVSGAGPSQGGGGSHGGTGGGNTNASYGELTAPVTPGAGGGYGLTGADVGGDGGGRIRVITDTLTLDGQILANGTARPQVNNLPGGGGAGGSIWVTTQTYSGAGSMHADGGPTTALNPGGGGRIAVYYTSGTPDVARITAWPGANAGQAGSAGTVYLKRGAETATLAIDDGGRGANDGRALGFAPSDTTQTLDVKLVLGGTTQLALGSPLSVVELDLRDDAVLTQLQTNAGYVGALTVTADVLRVGPNARLDVSGRGHGGDCGSNDASCGNGGHGANNVSGQGGSQLSGGGHGAMGGGPSPSRTHGTPFAPTTQGSGGGYGVSGGEPGGDGGGRIRLVVGTLELDGVLAADGDPGAGTRGGGGAGGSIFVSVQTLSGSGRMSVDGGAGGTSGGGGGGGSGGRLAVVYTTNDGFDLTRLSAVGGAGLTASETGGPGTLWIDGPTQDRLIVDNGGRDHINETAPWLEVGTRSVATVTTDGITVTGPVWLPDTLAGLQVDIGASRFTIVDNDTNSLTLTPVGSLAGVLVGERVVGRRTIVGALEVAAHSRVAFEDQLTVDDVVVADAAVLTHPPVISTRPEHWLDLAVTNTVLIGDTGAIDVSTRGYAGDCGFGDASCGNGGQGPNNTSGAGASQLGGGTHGGEGGHPARNRPYGNPAAPTYSGSGGGYGVGGGNPGAAGGGRVRITADRLVVDGALDARGTDATQTAGAGAGGSIWVVVGTLGGAGEVSAAGGDNPTGAGGGGGRVSIAWQDDLVGAPFDVDTIEVMGGLGVHAGGPGTLWLDKDGEASRLVVDNAEREHVNETSPWVEVSTRTVSAVNGLVITVGGPSLGWVPGDLIGAEVRFDDIAATHRVVNNTATALTLDAADGAPTVSVGSRIQGVRRFPGSLELFGASRVAMTDHLFGDDLTVSAATLTHPLIASNTGIFGLNLNIANRITVAADGRIDVSARGFAGDCSPADASCANGGQGNNNVSGAGGKQLSGGSFGGLGGGPTPNAIYGGTLDVWYPGAGGGYGAGGGNHGGAGGGRIKLIAGQLVLDGQLIADGGAGSIQSGGGAGGGIDVQVTTLSGGGSMAARGGRGGTTGGGGGGGRILLSPTSPAMTLTVTGGLSDTPTNNGAAGTATRN